VLVAKSRCSCGATVRWKVDEPESDEWLLVAQRDVPEDVDPPALLGVARQCALCSACGRLWVTWHDDSRLTEYVPADPSVRARLRRA
jgi:hypothetical protein